ncbi:MAG: arsenate reductase ArsC [Chlorobi bacterium]|nr:arsenate reductase ArsC [Chlorobiota bacterium]
MKILFVCTGNSCRSQMAEGILKSINPEFKVYSAGIKPEKEISQYAVKVLKETGIDISQQFPKNIEIFNDTQFDYLITFSRIAEEESRKIIAKNKLYFDIDDPFDVTGNEDEIVKKYREVRDEISKIVIDFIQKKIL